MYKYIKEVFGDYDKISNLTDAEIENINLYKKTNKLQINLLSNKCIKLTEIEEFENFLISKFQVSKAIIDINYGKTILSQTLKEDWENVLSYITKKEPTTKAMLKDSFLELKENEVYVNLFLKGANFLYAKKFDKGLEHLFENLYNKKYSVKFIEKVDENYDSRLFQKKLEEEKEILKQMQEQSEKEIIIAKEQAEIRKIEEEKRKFEELEKRKANLPNIR